jgi:hypothetical protein
MTLQRLAVTVKLTSMHLAADEDDCNCALDLF